MLTLKNKYGRQKPIVQGLEGVRLGGSVLRLNAEFWIPRIPFQTLIIGDTQKAYHRKLQLNKMEWQKEKRTKWELKKWNYN